MLDSIWLEHNSVISVLWLYSWETGIGQRDCVLDKGSIWRWISKYIILFDGSENQSENITSYNVSSNIGHAEWMIAIWYLHETDRHLFKETFISWLESLSKSFVGVQIDENYFGYTERWGNESTHTTFTCATCWVRQTKDGSVISFSHSPTLVLNNGNKHKKNIQSM